MEVSSALGTFSYSDFLKMMLGKRSAILKCESPVPASPTLICFLPLPPSPGSPSTHSPECISLLCLLRDLPRSYSYPWFWSPQPTGLFTCPFSFFLPTPHNPHPFLDFHSTSKLTSWEDCPLTRVSSHLNQDPDVWRESKRTGGSHQSPQPRKLSLELPWFVVREMWWDWRASNDSNIERRQNCEPDPD